MENIVENWAFILLIMSKLILHKYSISDIIFNICYRGVTIAIFGVKDKEICQKMTESKYVKQVVT